MSKTSKLGTAVKLARKSLELMTLSSTSKNEKDIEKFMELGFKLHDAAVEFCSENNITWDEVCESIKAGR